MKVFISALYITKNADTFLKYSMENIRPFVDEIIIADDMSTDNTVKIAEGFNSIILRSDYSGKYPVNSNEKGIGANKAKIAQRNACLNAAQGKWVFILDDDEIYHPDALKELMAYFKGIDSDVRHIRMEFQHIWKRPDKRILGHMWNMWPERIFRKMEGLNYASRSDTVCLPNGKFYVEQAGQVARVNIQFLKCFHYAYLEDPDVIRAKIRKYMLRDNPNVNEDNIEEWVNKHPYFSDNYGQPRYGPQGLYIAGTAEGHIEKVIDFPSDKHPLNMYKHPSMYREYLKGANKYMEEHWQFHNHLTYPRHQARLKYTSIFCIGETLEIGCANGFSTRTMQDANSKAHFSGLEVTDWGYAQAIKTYPEFQFYKGLGEFTHFEDGYFNTVLLAEIIEHCLNPRILADEAWRICNKRLIVTTPTQLHPDPDHKRFFPMEEMEKFLKPYGQAKFYGLDIDGIMRSEAPYYFLIAVVDK